MRVAWYTGRNERLIEWVVGRDAFWSWKTDPYVDSWPDPKPRVFCDMRQQDVQLDPGDVTGRVRGRTFVWKRRPRGG